ncbi:MAG: hypothetical protein M0R32_10415 [Candidatus Cloacimonetes bacterium]|jgi:hypothetical protein|nr:hypothetical protein [Candidatus Cloacimonadota bacterium]
MKNTKKTKSKTDLQECHGDLCGSINICYKHSPNDLFVCTRPAGHKGNHVACSGGSLHNMAVWKKAAKDAEVEVEDMDLVEDVNIEEEIPHSESHSCHDLESFLRCLLEMRDRKIEDAKISFH